MYLFAKHLKIQKWIILDGLPTNIRVEAPLGVDENVNEVNKYSTIQYNYLIGMMLYMDSKTRLYI